jgi:hypothetical protein
LRMAPFILLNGIVRRTNRRRDGRDKVLPRS